jgi:hypothetical protein
MEFVFENWSPPTMKRFIVSVMSCSSRVWLPPSLLIFTSPLTISAPNVSYESGWPALTLALKRKNDASTRPFGAQNA